VNFIWAIHQAHHSAEDFTLIAGLRQAVLQPFTAWVMIDMFFCCFIFSTTIIQLFLLYQITYVPLALTGIPPQIFLAHLQLGELSMLWLHTEVIQTLGPLELILNSPSHHRVHHGISFSFLN